MPRTETALALEPDEWKDRRALIHEPRADRSTEITVDDHGSLVIRLWIFDDVYDSTVPAEAIPKLIALANDALPDDNARKITRERLDALRAALGRPTDDGAVKAAYDFINVLEALLPPSR